MISRLPFKSAVFTLLLASASINTPAAVLDTETLLLPSPNVPDLGFGIDVAINGDTAAVGAKALEHGFVLYLYTQRNELDANTNSFDRPFRHRPIRRSGGVGQ